MFSIWKKSDNSADIARDRLRILIAHENNNRNIHSGDSIDLEKMKKEILEVISKYIHINDEDVVVKQEKNSNISTIEVNIVLQNDE